MYVGAYSALAAALFLLFYLTGHAASRSLAPLPAGARPEERWALRLTLGVAVWVLVLFALAALQRLRPAPIGGLIAAASAWGLWSAWKERTERSRSESPGRPTRAVVPRDPLAILLFAVLAVVLAALWAQTLRPIVAWDADVYHLTIPRLYLEHGGFRRIPFNVYSNWPLAVQLLFALAMVVKDYVLATALHFGFGVASIVLLGFVAARATTTLWGVIAAATLLLHPIFLFEIRVAYVDIACAFFLLAAVVALDRALEDRSAGPRWMALAGVACGVLASAKLNGVFGAVSIAIVYSVSSLRARTPLRALLRPLLAFAAPIVVLLSPWIAKTVMMTGNPVYPLLYDTFGGPEWSDALASAHRSWQRAIGMGRSPLDFLLLPARVLFLGAEGYERFDGRLHPLLGVLLPISFIGLRGQRMAARALGVAGLWFVSWAASSQQSRFLIPVLALLALTTVTGLHALVQRWISRRPNLLPRSIALVTVVFLVHANLRYLDQAPSLYAAYWTRSDELRAHATDEVFGAIDQRLPAEARLLFVNINRGFFCRREYIADSFFEASQTAAMLRDLAERGDLRSGLRELGITHVLIENRPRGIDYPRQFVELLASSRAVYRSPDGRFTVIALAL
jgi:hypothetical protein